MICIVLSGGVSVREKGTMEKPPTTRRMILGMPSSKMKEYVDYVATLPTHNLPDGVVLKEGMEVECEIKERCFGVTGDFCITEAIPIEGHRHLDDTKECEICGIRFQHHHPDKTKPKEFWLINGFEEQPEEGAAYVKSEGDGFMEMINSLETPANDNSEKWMELIITGVYNVLMATKHYLNDEARSLACMIVDGLHEQNLTIVKGKKSTPHTDNSQEAAIRKVVEDIFYSPATNGKAEESIQKGIERVKELLKK